MFSNSKIVLCLAMVSSSCFGMIQNRVEHDQDGFKVINSEGIKQVAYHNVSRDLMQMHRLDKVQDFITHGGKIRASRLDNGEFIIRSHVDGLGGGPGLAVLAYWGLNAAAIAVAAAPAWCPPLSVTIAVAGHAAATVAAVSLAVTPTP